LASTAAAADADELINKHSDKAVIEFEFGQEQQRFIAYRTIQHQEGWGASHDADVPPQR
jgi:hypothetical protein